MRIKLDKSNTPLLMDMIKDLFSEYKYFRIKRDQMIVLRDAWWKFWATEKISAFELCIMDIPNRLSGIYNIQRASKGLQLNSPNYRFQMSHLLSNDYPVDIVKDLYKSFAKVNFPFDGVPVIPYVHLAPALEVGTVTFREILNSKSNDGFLINSIRNTSKVHNVVRLVRTYAKKWRYELNENIILPPKHREILYLSTGKISLIPKAISA